MPRLSFRVIASCVLLLMALTCATARPAEAKLKCKDVSKRFQVCGDASRTKLVAGFGIRFNRKDQGLTAAPHRPQTPKVRHEARDQIGNIP